MSTAPNYWHPSSACSVPPPQNIPHKHVCTHVTSHSLLSLVQIAPSYFYHDNCAVLPFLPFRKRELETQRCEEIVWCDRKVLEACLHGLSVTGVSGFEHDFGDEDTLRTGQEGEVLVPGTPGAAETRPGSGVSKAALRRSPGQQPSLWVTISLFSRKALGLLLQQQPGWGPRPRSPRVQAAHQLALGPVEYFRVESLFTSALPSITVTRGPELSAREVGTAAQVGLGDAEFTKLV